MIEHCMASYFHSRAAHIAAHKTLPFGTQARVTNLGNGRSVMVTIHDRGPFIAGRCIDLSVPQAGAIGMMGSGVARVAVEVVAMGQGQSATGRRRYRALRAAAQPPQAPATIPGLFGNFLGGV